MKIVIFLYPEFTALDAIGPYEVLAHAPGVDLVFVAKEKGIVVADSERLKIVVDYGFDDIEACDILLIPGGQGEAPLCYDEETLNWVRKIHATTTYTTSVCTGSLILAAAGILDGKKATTHWAAADILNEFGASYQAERWVEEGKIITAAGVSAGIDMALYLLADMQHEDVARSVQLAIEYDPQPPFDNGSVAKSVPHVHEALSQMFEQKMRGRHNAAKVA